MKSKILYLPVFVFFCILIIFSKTGFSEELFDVNYDPIAKKINIVASKSIKPEVLNVENPPRMVLDFPMAVFLPGLKKIEVNDSNIKQIKISQYRSNPPVARVSIELNKNINFEVRSSIGDEKQNIQVTALENENVPIIINNESLNKNIKARKVRNNVESIEYRGSSIVISGKDRIRYEISKANEADTYFLKLLDFSMNGLKEMPVKSGQEILNISIDEKNNQSVITFKLKSGLKLAAKNIASGKLEVFANETNINDQAVTPSSPISLDFNDTPETTRLFISSAKNTLKYRVFELSNPDRLVIDTFNTTISDFSDPFANKNSNFIQKVRFGYLDKTQAPDEGIRIVLELKKKLNFKENFQNNKILELVLYDDDKNLANLEHKTLVVLDPGHGGNDPGALGPNGNNEKTVTLAVTYFVRQMLIDNGIGVIMTRTDDSEILLQPRVDIANNNKADLFVSVHCNAMDGPSPIGIETYFRTPQSENLANVMHRNLVKNLPTSDRGIRVRNFFVIHHTTMPSVLLEIGYITNPTEGAALGNPVYQKKVASAIFKGIKEYLNNQTKI